VIKFSQIMPLLILTTLVAFFILEYKPASSTREDDVLNRSRARSTQALTPPDCTAQPAEEILPGEVFRVTKDYKTHKIEIVDKVLHHMELRDRTLSYYSTTSVSRVIFLLTTTWG